MQKKKILIVNEFSQLATGFATYMRYLLPILHKTDKYILAEHASYINEYHPLIDSVPWKVYPNEPDPNDPKQIELYKQDRSNQFGKWKLEQVLIDFRPHVVVSIRDPFFDDFIFHSPLRKYFKYIHMTTCDGQPQKQEWIDMFKGADRLLTYSLWAKNLLDQESGGQLRVHGVTSPCPDLEIFKPRSKKEAKIEYGLEEDCIIFGTVMRNQPRKLFPDLMKSFVRYLELCKETGKEELAKKSYLYFHTSVNDVGWAMNEELRRYKLSHKVLFTYMCDHCKSVYPSFIKVMEWVVDVVDDLLLEPLILLVVYHAKS